MDFIFNKLILILIFSNVYLGTDFDLPRNDLLILNNGEEISCQVQSAIGGVIKITTKDGEKTIVRELREEEARDMIETGIIKTNRYSGHLTYLDPDYLEIQTSSGLMKVRKSKLRKIIISQEPSFNL